MQLERHAPSARAAPVADVLSTSVVGSYPQPGWLIDRERPGAVLVMGDDWAGKFDMFEDVCEVVYLPRTPAISTTALIEKSADGG